LEQQKVVCEMQEDEIDLRELVRTILKYKKFIISFSCIITFFIGAYIFVKPVSYEGTMLIEIGKIIDFDTKTQKINITDLGNNYDLQEILNKKFGVSSIIPFRSQNLLAVRYVNQNKKNIQNKLDDVFAFIKERHQEKIKLYSVKTSKIYSTKIISQSISHVPVRKKLFISIGFIASFVFTIFLVLCLEFIKSYQKGN
jgi:LPS O-antigen subunit length determinant protein (WzzB/FepE family)